MDTELIKKYLDMFKIALIIALVAILGSIGLLIKIIPEIGKYFNNKNTYSKTEKELADKEQALETAKINKAKQEAKAKQRVEIKTFFKNIKNTGNSTADILAGEIEEINDLVKYYGLKVYKIDYKYDPEEDIFYKENFDKSFIGKANLDLNEVVQMSSPGTKQDYVSNANDKQTAKISSTEIVLEKDQECLQAIFWYNTGCYDLSNFQSGIINNNYRNKLKKNIEKFKEQNGKTVVFMTGNLIGKEWELNYLRTAVMKISSENNLQEGAETTIRRLYYGLKKRREQLVNDIKFCLNNGAEEIYLMKGQEEFRVSKVTGIDILQDVVNIVNDPRVKYIKEGTETKVNIIKKVKGKSTIYNVIKLQTNFSSKSENVAVMERINNVEEKADASFICGGNYTAAIKNENIYYPSGQLNFFNATKGSHPKFMTNDGNIFQIYAEGNHDLNIVKGGQQLFEPNAELINALYLENKKTKALGDVLIAQIQEKQRALMSDRIHVSHKVKHQKPKFENNKE